MSDKFVISLEHQQALVALIVQSGRPLKPIRSFFDDTRCRFDGRLVFVDFSGFLSGVLEPHDDHPWTKIQQFRQILEVVVFRISVVFEKFL